MGQGCYGNPLLCFTHKLTFFPQAVPRRGPKVLAHGNVNSRMKQRSCPLHNAPKDSGCLVLSTCMSPVDELAPLRIGKSFMARCGAPLRGDLLTSAKRNLHVSSPPAPALGSFFRGVVCLVIADWPTRQSLRLLRLGSLPESAASNTQGTPPKSTSRVTSTSNGRRVGRDRGTDWRDGSGRARDGAGRGGRAGNALFRAVQRRPVGARTSIRREGGTLVRQTDRQTDQHRLRSNR